MLANTSICLSGVIAAALSVTLASAQSAPTSAGNGTQPVSARQKRTMSDANSAIAAAAAAPVTGKFVANITIKLVTPLPSGYAVACTLTANVTDENKTAYTLNNEISEYASVKATVSGSTATCSVPLPYSWSLTDASTDTAELGYSLSYVNTSTTTTTTVARSSSQFVPGAGAIKIPATGSTTTYTISATM